MELIYLWVENYKNIEKQGFNFSPRFNCKYNPDTQELTIDKNDDYVNIFPENINITAIVGENGSGKTTLLEEIITTMPTGIVLYLINNELCGYLTTPNSKTVKNNTNKTFKKLDSNKMHLHISSDMMKLDNVGDLFDYFSVKSQFSNQHFQLSRQESEQIDLSKYKKNINSLLLKHINIVIKNSFIFKPSSIQFYKSDKESKIDLTKKLELYIGQGSIEMSLLNLDDNEFIQLSQSVKDDDISLELYDDKGRSLYDFSQGERNIFINNLIIIDEVKKINDCIILLDEPDLTLHPQWQKNYINQLITMLSSISNTKLHIIITSHSPFLISDLPKENVIFLEKGKQVYPFENKQTFGANIHTLLSDGFFMKDGLMGEFAKGKIEAIKKFYEKVMKSKDNPNRIKKYLCYYNKKKKEFKHIHSIIGEPFLKTIMGNYLDELEFLLSDGDTLIDKELRELEERKKYLESLKNG